jgi:hypothetical protein
VRVQSARLTIQTLRSNERYLALHLGLTSTRRDVHRQARLRGFLVLATHVLGGLLYGGNDYV